MPISVLFGLLNETVKVPGVELNAPQDPDGGELLGPNKPPGAGYGEPENGRGLFQSQEPRNLIWGALREGHGMKSTVLPSHRVFRIQHFACTQLFSCFSCLVILHVVRGRPPVSRSSWRVANPRRSRSSSARSISPPALTVSFMLSLAVPFGLCAEFVAVEVTIVTAGWLRAEQRWWAWCAAWREFDSFLSP